MKTEQILLRKRNDIFSVLEDLNEIGVGDFLIPAQIVTSVVDYNTYISGDRYYKNGSQILEITPEYIKLGTFEMPWEAASDTAIYGEKLTGIGQLTLLISARDGDWNSLNVRMQLYEGDSVIQSSNRIFNEQEQISGETVVPSEDSLAGVDFVPA